MELYDTGIGDILDIPAHHPRVVTVTGWTSACLRHGDFACVSWQGTGGWSGWRGTTTLSERAQVKRIHEAGPDDPVRKQYEADLEASLAVLLASDG